MIKKECVQFVILFHYLKLMTQSTTLCTYEINPDIHNIFYLFNALSFILQIALSIFKSLDILRMKYI